MYRERKLHPWPVLAVFACMTLLHAQERVDPTFLYRDSAQVAVAPSPITSDQCHYKPLFGEGDRDASALVGIAVYGEAIVDPGGTCRSELYPQEDEVYVVLEGAATVDYYGAEAVSLSKEDYLYLPASIAHCLRNTGSAPATVLIMGFRTRGFEKAPLPPHPLKANIEDVPTQPVSGHPKSALYRLLMGDVESNRDRIRAGRVLTSLFLMEIAPGGTNFPHHHEREEEIYLVLSGHGTMVAGGGEDGVEGKRPAKAGDAYFFRLNCTVGYYSSPDTASRILAVRSWYPGMQQKGVQH